MSELAERGFIQLLVTGNAELANEKDVKGRAEGVRHFRSDWHAAPREAQHDHVDAPGIGRECLTKATTGISTIEKWHGVSDAMMPEFGLPRTPGSPYLSVQAVTLRAGG